MSKKVNKIDSKVRKTHIRNDNKIKQLYEKLIECGIPVPKYDSTISYYSVALCGAYYNAIYTNSTTPELATCKTCKKIWRKTHERK